MPGRFGQPYRYEEECESTQLLLRPTDPEGAVAVADYQSAGRGRLGRRWVAPPGRAIHVSILLRPPPSRPIAQVSLLGGLAAAEVVEEELGLSAQVKWPNDVMVNRRKVASVLAEAHNSAIVLGIGINVNQTREQLPEDARQPPGSLRTADGPEHDRDRLLTELLDRLERLYWAWVEGGLDAVYHGLGARDFLRGRRVTVDGLTGVAGGIDREGRLLVDGQTVESGGVEYER